MVASFREGECSRASIWSLDGAEIIEREEPNICDKRRSEPAAYVYVWPARIEGDLLLLGSSNGYRRGTESSVGQLFIFDGYGGTVELRAELSDPLVAGQETAVELTMTNVSALEKDLQHLSISMQALQPTDNAFTAVGEEVTLTALDLTGILLALTSAVFRNTQI